MSSLFVKNLPSIKEREFKYRARMSSHELNQMQKEAFDDILDLFNKANQLQKTMYEMQMANGIESACYAKRLQDAIQEMQKLHEQYQNLTSQAGEFRTVTRYAYEAVTDDDGYGAVVDQNTNDIVAHIVSSVSKTRLHDETYDEYLVAPSLTAFLGPDTFREGGNIYSIEDSELNNAFDGNKSTTWFRTVKTTPDVECIENEIVIGLPEDIITSRLMNQISIHTFPVGFVDIMDVKFKSNGAWQTIPGFENHYGCTQQQRTDIFGNVSNYFAINDTSNVKFNFQNLQTNQIKIKLRQRHYDYDAENNRRIWHLGLRDVDVVYNIYTRDHSEFDMIFDFPETDRNIKVYDVEVKFNNPNLTDDENFGVTKEFYYYDADGNAHKIASTCPFILDGHKMMVKFTIEGNQTTPNIYAASVKYKLT